MKQWPILIIVGTQHTTTTTKLSPVQLISSEASEQSTTSLQTELLLRQRCSGWQNTPPDCSHASADTSTPPANDAKHTNTHKATSIKGCTRSY